MKLSYNFNKQSENIIELVERTLEACNTFPKLVSRLENIEIISDLLQEEIDKLIYDTNKNLEEFLQPHKILL